MDGRSLRPIHLIVSLGGPYISVIHCLQQARLEIRFMRFFLQRGLNLVDALVPPEWLGSLHLFERSAQQAFFALL